MIPPWEISSVISDIKSLARRASFSFAATRRSANQVANWRMLFLWDYGPLMCLALSFCFSSWWSFCLVCCFCPLQQAFSCQKKIKISATKMLWKYKRLLLCTPNFWSITIKPIQPQIFSQLLLKPILLLIIFWSILIGEWNSNSKSSSNRGWVIMTRLVLMVNNKMFLWISYWRGILEAW